MKPITIFEAFAGIGSQIMSLKNLGIPTKSVGVAEVNEAAILSYAAIHADPSISIPDTTADYMQDYMKKLNIPLNDKGKRVILKGKRLERLYKASKAIHNVGDISKMNPDELADLTLFTYSFPCQSISFAGLQHGLAKDSNTRSSLLWECERIIEAKKPDYLLMENVKALVSKTFKPDFDKWCALLEELGYTVLTSRDSDIDVDFKTERSRMVNKTNSDIFISIHFNATGNIHSKASGIQTYSYSDESDYPSKINKYWHNHPDRMSESKRLAAAIHSSLLAETGAKDAGLLESSFAVLRETAKPAVLLELGYMDNFTESQQIRDSHYQDKLVAGIVKGIQKYYAGK